MGSLYILYDHSSYTHDHSSTLLGLPEFLQLLFSRGVHISQRGGVYQNDFPKHTHTLTSWANSTVPPFTEGKYYYVE